MLPRLLTGQMFRQDPVEFLTENARRYGDLVHFRAFEGHVYQFNHPALIQELMVEGRCPDQYQECGPSSSLHKGPRHGCRCYSRESFSFQRD